MADDIIPDTNAVTADSLSVLLVQRLWEADRSEEESLHTHTHTLTPLTLTSHCTQGQHLRQIQSQ